MSKDNKHAFSTMSNIHIYIYINYHDHHIKYLQQQNTKRLTMITIKYLI